MEPGKRRDPHRRRAGARAIQLVLGLALAVSLFHGARASAATAVGRGHAVAPGHRAQPPAYWGTWIGKQLTGEEPPWDMRPVAQLESILGKGMSLIGLGSPFADCSPAPCRFFEFPTSA